MATFADATDVQPIEVAIEAPAPVVGGEVAPEGRWPDAVALYTATQFACSGVLIAPDLVLSAGHCGYGIRKVVVGTGDHQVGGREVEVAANHVHPDHLSTLDVTVFQLAEPVTAIPPRMLARGCVIEDDLYAGADVAIVGFGAIDEWGTEWTSELHQAFTTVGDPACEDLDAGCNESVSPGGELVAGGDGIDSCTGDSGGPLYLLGSHGETLVGITSRATMGATTVCGGGGIYVRADAIAPWVEETLGVELPLPACGGNGAPHPTADPIEVVQGDLARVDVDPGDPDPGQGFRYTVVVEPSSGRAGVDPDGVAWYDATGAVVGDDSFTVEVTDDGDPPRSGAVVVSVRVLPGLPAPLPHPQGRRCGCATGGWPGSLGLLALAPLLRRRRADARSPSPARHGS